jgi:two-component system cell cycle response regulator
MQTSETQRTAVVVDNDIWERWFATEVLAGNGYAVLGASNGASALRLVEQHQCDVILMDLALPELPGLEFLQHLKATASTREVPVIVLGATPESRPCAAQGYVPKPLDGGRVMHEVGRVLRGHRLSEGQRTVSALAARCVVSRIFAAPDGASRGSTTIKRVPPPGRESAQMRPP